MIRRPVSSKADPAIDMKPIAYTIKYNLIISSELYIFYLTKTYY